MCVRPSFRILRLPLTVTRLFKLSFKDLSAKTKSNLEQSGRLPIHCSRTTSTTSSRTPVQALWSLDIVEGAMKRYIERHQPSDCMDVGDGAVALKVGSRQRRRNPSRTNLVKADEELLGIFLIVSFYLFLLLPGGCSERSRVGQSYLCNSAFNAFEEELSTSNLSEFVRSKWGEGKWMETNGHYRPPKGHRPQPPANQ